MGKSLAVFWNSFLLLQSFWVKNTKIDFFLRKKCFERSFYKIEVFVVTNWSTRLEQHQKIESLLMVGFYAFLKILHFSIFFFRFLKFISSSC